MSKPVEIYRPCNGTEGDWFRAQFCDKCQRDKPEIEEYCDILGRTFLHAEDAPEYPSQWRIENDKPVCTAFWPHGVDDDPAHIVTDDRTLEMFGGMTGRDCEVERDS